MPFWGAPKYSRLAGGTQSAVYDYWTSEGVINSDHNINAPIFYDSNDTSYYLNPASTSNLNAVTWSGGSSANANTAYTHSQAAHAPSNANYITNNNQILNGASYLTTAGKAADSELLDGINSTSFLRSDQDYETSNGRLTMNGGIGFPASNGATYSRGSDPYGIYQESGAWSSPYPDLNIGFHTGISIGAHPSYGGVRFFSNSDMLTQIMSVGNSADGLGAGYVYVNAGLVAGTSLRAPTFYDTDNTSYYLNPASTSTSIKGAGVSDMKGGFKSTANPWNTSDSAYFPNGITTAGGTNWIYGNTYIGNAPSNGAGTNFRSNGTEDHLSIQAATSHGASGKWLNTASSGGNFTPYSFESERGNHSWGTVARFRINNSTDTDRPSIQFSSGQTETRWSIGYCAADDHFRIVQNLGYRNDNSTSDGWGTERLKVDTSGNLSSNGIYQSNASLRAPIFYDSDNTGYYLNPNSDSNLYRGKFRANDQADNNYTLAALWTQNYNSGPAGIAFHISGNVGKLLEMRTNGILYWNNSEVLTTSSGYLPLSGGTLTGDITVGSGNTSSNIYMADSNGTQRRIHTNSNRIGFLNSSNNWGAYCDNGGNWYSDHSMRAPIFYDSNDTTYFTNPAGTSNLLQLTVPGSSNGWSAQLGTASTSRVYNDSARASLVINSVNYPHLYINATGGTSNTNHGGVISMTGNTASGYRRWSMGWPSYNPTVFSMGSYDNNTNPHYGCGGGLGVTTWGSRFWFDTSGNGQAHASLRAPIFYDSNNTSYYVDAGSTTQLNHLSVNSTLASRNFATGSMGYILENRSTGGATFRFDGDSFIFYGGGGVGNVFEMNQDGNSTGRTSLRAPIFYDSNNTGYYLNPASTSNLNVLTLAGTATASNFILSSDERKKTKIKDLPRNNINTNWKSFEMKNDEGEYRTGVIAQELEETHPEFVNTDPEGFKSVKYIDLLIAKIAELEARLEKLEK
jgi:hypothetical protein